MPKANEISADVIDITVSGGFSTEHFLATAGGALGRLQINASRSEAVFRGAEGQELHFERTSLWKSRYRIADHQNVLGSAAPIKALSRKFALDLEGKAYSLVPGGTKIRSWRVLDSQERTLFEIQPKGGFKRGAALLIFEETALNLLVFAYCLVQKRWQEESSAA